MNQPALWVWGRRLDLELEVLVEVMVALEPVERVSVVEKLFD